MLANPKLGQKVQIWYARYYRHFMPLHGLTGIIVEVGKRKPRNHGIDINGMVYVIPCGNLRTIPHGLYGGTRSTKRR